MISNNEEIQGLLLEIYIIDTVLTNIVIEKFSIMRHEKRQAQIPNYISICNLKKIFL
jgi:hypothetical protein